MISSRSKLRTLLLHPQDDVVVALEDLQAGDILEDGTKVLSHTKAKHKISRKDANKGESFRMYGIIVGRATESIQKGEILTTRNLQHDTVSFEVRHSSYRWIAPDISKFKSRTFRGYPRADGQIGTRNHWLVIPLVFCENRNVEYLKNAFVKQLGYAIPDKYEALVAKLIELDSRNAEIDISNLSVHSVSSVNRIFSNVDGIKFLTHSGGCGGTREDSDNLCKLIAGYLQNPNVAGATILSLGCQHAQVSNLKAHLEKRSLHAPKPLLVFEQQNFSSEESMLGQAVVDTFLMLKSINKITRVPAPLSKLCVGLKCGGSDGFSGITANPAMGFVSDMIVGLGGTTILAEFPELCGVEQELIDRSVSIEVASKFAGLMREYNARAEAVGSGFSMNPSPGNIADGLLTDAMKSAGAAKKGGSAPIVDVLNYGEYVTKSGLNLLCTPGNDVEATTGMAGSGATLIIFSTGLGTPTGNPVAPIVKTSTNETLAQKQRYLIDFDHGNIITQNVSIQESGEALLEYIIRVASGESFTKAEQLQQDDFIPWKNGVSL